MQIDNQTNNPTTKHIKLYKYANRGCQVNSFERIESDCLFKLGLSSLINNIS